MEYSLGGFNGQRPDPNTGYYHLGNGYRAYSPLLARFTIPDSWSPFGNGGVNPYAYCAGDPANRTDRSGHFSLGLGLGMALGLVAGIMLSVVTEGAAMPAVLTLMATVGGEAAIGAGVELVTEAANRQRINWGQVGIAAGISAVASLAGFGVGKAVSKAFRSVTGSLATATNNLSDGYAPAQVAAWDRVATRGLGGGRLPGGAGVVPLTEHARAATSVVSHLDAAYLGFSDVTLKDSVIAYNGVPGRPWYLDVLVHSGPDAEGVTRVPVNGYNLDAAQFHSMLQVSYPDYDMITSIRVIGCHIGNEGSEAYSFAAQLSDVSGKAVVGYRGVVDTDMTPRLSAYLDQTAYGQFVMSGYNYSQMNGLLRQRLSSFSIADRTINIANAIPIVFEP